MYVYVLTSPHVDWFALAQDFLQPADATHGLQELQGLRAQDGTFLQAGIHRWDYAWR
jgi:hypothetical protein